MGRLAFRPETLSPSVVYGLALVPPVAAGLAIFGLPAAIELGIAVGVGAVFEGASRLVRKPPRLSPIVAAVTACALIGPGAAPWWAAVVAAVAGVFEIARSIAPRAVLPYSSGLLAYGAVALAGQGHVAAYLAPGRSSRPFLEPIRLGQQFFGLAAAPLDPVTLYVGNVAGPVFATSLLAVTIGAFWLWYAKRLDLVATFGIAAGGLAAVLSHGWNPAYQLLSGPLLFAAAFGFADRKTLAGPPIIGGLLGAAAAYAGVWWRARGLGVETVLISLAVAQATLALMAAIAWTFTSGAVRRGISAVRRSRPAPAEPRIGPAEVQRR